MKIAEDYLDLPYHYVVVPSEGEPGDRGWVAQIAEWYGCIAQGRSPDELMTNIGRAMLAWVSAEIEDGHDIPLPYPDDFDNDTLLVPMPVAARRALSKEARRRDANAGAVAAELLDDALTATAGARAAG